MSWLKRRLPKKRWKRVCLYLLSILLILIAADLILAACWRRIDISPQTTNIIAPLDKNGMPNYITALNDRASEGVNADNNAAPELLRLIGTEHFPPEWCTEVLPQLGLPAEAISARFMAYDQWRVAHPEIKGPQGTDEIDAMTHTPWKAEDHPLWARWLDEQSGAIPQALKALEKSRFYIPYQSLAERPLMIAIILPNLGGLRKLSQLLMADAERKLGEGDVEGFQTDVLAALKLSRLLGKKPSSLIETMVAFAIDGMARRAIDSAAVGPVILSENQARKLFQAVENMPALSNQSLTLERWSLLDSICFVSVKGPATLQMIDGANSDSPGFGGRIGFALIPIHYNEILLEANQRYDRIEAAFELPNYPSRKAALNDLDVDLLARYNKPLIQKLVNPSRAMIDLFFEILAPSLAKANQLQEQGHMEWELSRLALALRIYHDQHGEFPRLLDSLAPSILPQIPQDSFVDAPLKYRREGKGYVLYSVGPNEKDNGGKPRSTTSGKDWDIVVRAAE